MVATTNAIAKIAAVVAGLGLVAMSFASFAVPAKAATTDEQIAALMAQIAALQGGSSASVTFTMDLTLGSSGAEVTALQNWLISKGYSIPAGATGYFGAQTQSALAAYQAANGITPAAGYFGPITRAKVNAAGGSTSTPGGSTGGLSGGEADLNNFDLIGGDDLSEGDEGVEIAIAEFDVDDGDARLQRVTIDFQPTSSADNEHPWEYVDTLSVYLDGKKIGDVDAGSKSDWDSEDDDTDHSTSLDFYSIEVSVDGVVKEGDTAELSIQADAQSSIDASDSDTQTFKVQIPDDGIRAVDGAGIQQYVGDGEEITLAFDAAENGDLTVKKSSDTPEAGTLVGDSTDTSDEYDVLAFEIKNTDNADALLNELTVTVATGTADSVATDISDMIRRATLTVDGDDFDGDINNTGTIDFDDLDVILAGDDTTKFTLSIELYGQSGHWQATGQTLTFSVVGSTGVDAEGEDTGDASTVSGTATGFAQNLAVDGGVTVEGNTSSTALTYNSNTPSASYGTFTIKFDVTAVGDDVYIPKTVGTTSVTAGTNGNGTTTYAGAVINNSLSSSAAGFYSGNGTTTVSMTTTADSSNTDFYIIYAGDTETFTVTTTIDPSSTGTFQIGLDRVRFSSVNDWSSSLQTLDVDQSDSEFRTDPLVVPNS